MNSKLLLWPDGPMRLANGGIIADDVQESMIDTNIPDPLGKQNVTFQMSAAAFEILFSIMST